MRKKRRKKANHEEEEEEFGVFFKPNDSLIEGT
jgi:hypothetical protein